MRRSDRCFTWNQAELTSIALGDVIAPFVCVLRATGAGRRQGIPTAIGGRQWATEHPGTTRVQDRQDAIKIVNSGEFHRQPATCLAQSEPDPGIQPVREP